MLTKLAVISKAREAQIVALVNALFGVLLAFNIVLTSTQLGAIDIAVNAFLALFAPVSSTVTKMARRLKRP